LFDYQAYLQLNSAKSNGNYINAKFGYELVLPDNQGMSLANDF